MLCVLCAFAVNSYSGCIASFERNIFKDGNQILSPGKPSVRHVNLIQPGGWPA
jgi:hypothetical protein